jgi:hypothetical protein
MQYSYSFKIPGNHPATTVWLESNIFTFTVTCNSPTVTTSFQLTAPDASYSVATNDKTFQPSGDSTDPSTYQTGSLVVPSVSECGGGAMTITSAFFPRTKHVMSVTLQTEY